MNVNTYNIGLFGDTPYDANLFTLEPRIAAANTQWKRR